MSIDINGLGPNNQDPLRGRKTSGGAAPEKAAESSAKPQSESAPAASTSVNLSSTAQLLSRVDAEVKQSSDVDNAKVEALKSAIQNGEYNVDPENMAQKMLDLE